MMGRRSVIEMYVSVLDVCRTPQCKSRIMYKSNVNCQVLSSMLDALVSKGLVKVDGDTSPNKASFTYVRCRYYITSEGLEVLKTWSVLEQQLGVSADGFQVY